MSTEDEFEWVPRKGILVAVPIAAPRSERTETDVERAIGDLIACPTCHAKVSELCKTRTGRHRQEHASRLVPRRCHCGGAVGPGKKMCDLCRAEARRENGRIGMQNTRARRRLEVA